MIREISILFAITFYFVTLDAATAQKIPKPYEPIIWNCQTEFVTLEGQIKTANVTIKTSVPFHLTNEERYFKFYKSQITIEGFGADIPVDKLLIPKEFYAPSYDKDGSKRKKLENDDIPTVFKLGGNNYLIYSDTPIPIAKKNPDGSYTVSKPKSIHIKIHNNIIDPEDLHRQLRNWDGTCDLISGWSLK